MVPSAGPTASARSHTWGETPTHAVGTHQERSIMAKGSRGQACTIP